MTQLSAVPPLPDPNVAGALARVHRRLRRRRNRMRGAGAAAAFAVVLIVALGTAAQGSAPDRGSTFGMSDGVVDGPPAALTGSEDDGCSPAAGPADWLGLELTISGREEWQVSSAPILGPPSALVTVKNVSDRPRTIWDPILVGHAEEGSADPAPGGRSLMPISWTLEPGETIELRASFPGWSCSGAPLGPGDYEFTPTIAVDVGDGSKLVSGTPITVVYR